MAVGEERMGAAAGAAAAPAGAAAAPGRIMPLSCPGEQWCLAAAVVVRHGACKAPGALCEQASWEVGAGMLLGGLAHHGGSSACRPVRGRAVPSPARDQAGSGSACTPSQQGAAAHLQVRVLGLHAAQPVGPLLPGLRKWRGS